MIRCRLDSAFYKHSVVTAILTAKAQFSITARMDKAVQKAISGIPETAVDEIVSSHSDTVCSVIPEDIVKDLSPGRLAVLAGAGVSIGSPANLLPAAVFTENVLARQAA